MGVVVVQQARCVGDGVLRDALRCHVAQTIPFVRRRWIIDLSVDDLSTQRRQAMDVHGDVVHPLRVPLLIKPWQADAALACQSSYERHGLSTLRVVCLNGSRLEMRSQASGALSWWFAVFHSV